MSKLNVDLLTSSIDQIVKFSQGETINVRGHDIKGKKRKFVEENYFLLEKFYIDKYQVVQCLN